jgi:hypothetical protein
MFVMKGEKLRRSLWWEEDNRGLPLLLGQSYHHSSCIKAYLNLVSLGLVLCRMRLPLILCISLLVSLNVGTKNRVSCVFIFFGYHTDSFHSNTIVLVRTQHFDALKQYNIRTTYTGRYVSHILIFPMASRSLKLFGSTC